MDAPRHPSMRYVSRKCCSLTMRVTCPLTRIFSFSYGFASGLGGTAGACLRGRPRPRFFGAPFPMPFAASSAIWPATPKRRRCLVLHPQAFESSQLSPPAFSSAAMLKKSPKTGSHLAPRAAPEGGASTALLLGWTRSAGGRGAHTRCDRIPPRDASDAPRRTRARAEELAQRDEEHAARRNARGAELRGRC